MTLADSQAIAALLNVQPATIRSWAHRGRIKRRGKDQQGRTLYDIAEARTLRPDTPTPANLETPGPAACNT